MIITTVRMTKEPEHVYNTTKITKTTRNIQLKGIWTLSIIMMFGMIHWIPYNWMVIEPVWVNLTAYKTKDIQL